MLLIFDIDDTLVDTSGTLLPPLLKNALLVLQKRGVSIGDFDAAYAALRRLDAASISSEEALHEFVELHGGSSKDFEEALREIYAPKELPSTIDPVEGALILIADSVKKHTLSIVSKGKEEIQKEKLRRAGISDQFFDHMLISETRQKKEQYQKILNSSGISSEKVMVIGDRIERDLTPAKALGMTTVHIKWGRGLGYTGIKTDVDYTITSLTELRAILDE